MASTPEEPSSSTVPTRLRELALLFLKLGTTAFGGPAAHIAMMQDEVVRRRRWLSEQQFLDHLSAANFIPGPSSTELAIFIGRRRAGWRGLLIAGICFIVPATLLVGILAWAYVRFGKLPQIAGVLYGVKPVVIAVILQALWKLGRSAVTTKWLAVIGLIATVLTAMGVHLLIVLALGGLLAASQRLSSGLGAMPGRSRLLLFGTKAAGSGAALGAGAGAAGLWPLFLVFAKIGAVLFGSGYVLLAFLRADLVERHAWLTSQQLLDAVAVGQVTPGPVFTTATFIGYILHGTSGACVATVGIFLPAFVLVALSAPILPRLRSSAVAGAVLDGVNVASLALMAIVTWQLGRAALVDVPSVVIAAVSAIALLRFRVNSSWLVLGAAVVGAVLKH